MEETDILGDLDFCVSQPDIDTKNNKGMRALVQKNFLWPVGHTIKIVFLNEPEPRPFYDIFAKDQDYFFQVPMSTLKYKESKTPDGSKMDPLEITFENLKDRPGGLKKQVPLAIETIIQQRFEPYVNLKFVFLERKDKDIADISIEFDKKSGCSSRIGSESARTKPGQASMVFSWFSVETVMHEVGHALGMLHEHQNSRNNTIDWNREKVIKWAQKTQGWTIPQIEKNILNYIPESNTNGTSFDPLSIMKYAYPAELTLDNKAINKCMRISYKDIEFLASVYPPTKDQLWKGITQLSEFTLAYYKGKVPMISLPVPIGQDAKIPVNLFYKWVYPDQEPAPIITENYSCPVNFYNTPQNTFMSKYHGYNS